MLLLLGVHLGLTIIIDGPLVAASILAAEVEGHEASEKEGHGDCGGECDMSRNKSIRNQQKVSKLMVLKNVPWRVFRQEAVSRDGTTQVAETDVHGDTDTTLETATDVVAVPCNTHGYQWVDTRSSEEGTGVLDAGLTGTGKHGESDGLVVNTRAMVLRDHCVSRRSPQHQLCLQKASWRIRVQPGVTQSQQKAAQRFFVFFTYLQASLRISEMDSWMR